MDSHALVLVDPLGVIRHWSQGAREPGSQGAREPRASSDTSQVTLSDRLWTSSFRSPTVKDIGRHFTRQLVGAA